MDVTRARSLAAWLAVAAACGTPARVTPRVPDALPARVVVVDGAGAVRDVRALVQGAPAAVVTFFSAHCPCQRAHDARLRALYDAYHPRGVAFVAVDSESGAAPARDAAEATARGYPFPLVSDPDGAAARALGADFATFTLVVDGAGQVRYAGGIDTDRSHLTDDAAPFVRDALDDVLAGRPARVARGKVLGCALER